MISHQTVGFTSCEHHKIKVDIFVMVNIITVPFNLMKICLHCCVFLFCFVFPVTASYQYTKSYFLRGVLSPKLYMHVPAAPGKFWLFLHQFFHSITHLSVCHILKEKHPSLHKLVAFYQNLLQIHLIYISWAPLLQKPNDRCTKFRDKAPQRAGTYIYTYTTISMWEPPKPGAIWNSGINII